MTSSDTKEAIQRLVANDDLERAIEAVLEHVDRSSHPDLAQELVMLTARLSRARTQVRKGLATAHEEGQERARVGYALLELLEEVPAGRAADRVDRKSAKRTAFISYNHADRTVAARLTEALKANGVDVRIDSDSMLPGEQIRAFIDRAMRDTDATVSIVSSTSLLSPWVGTETLLTLRRESFLEGKRFIAAYLDEKFFEPGFRLEATCNLDERIAQLDALIPEYQANKLDTNDLNDERTRLHELRHGLGEILSRLRGSLSVDIREATFEQSVQRMVKAILSDHRNTLSLV